MRCDSCDGAANFLAGEIPRNRAIPKGYGVSKEQSCIHCTTFRVRVIAVIYNALRSTSTKLAAPYLLS
jgi:hypothetical protein